MRDLGAFRVVFSSVVSSARKPSSGPFNTRPHISVRCRQMAFRSYAAERKKRDSFRFSAKRVKRYKRAAETKRFSRHGNKTRKYGNSRGNSDNRPETSTDYLVVSAEPVTFLRSFVCFFCFYSANNLAIFICR